MELVFSLAQRTLVSKAKTWYVNANVKDKPQGLTIFTGGFLKYREFCAAVAQGGYRDFAFEPRSGETTRSGGRSLGARMGRVTKAIVRKATLSRAQS